MSFLSSLTPLFICQRSAGLPEPSDSTRQTGALRINLCFQGQCAELFFFCFMLRTFSIQSRNFLGLVLLSYHAYSQGLNEKPTYQCGCTVSYSLCSFKHEGKDTQPRWAL